ncbi:MAG: signal peptidase I [Clostridiales bacterium]|nr:signal peptidase I [Clostridiales bacterium]
MKTFSVKNIFLNFFIIIAAIVTFFTAFVLASGAKAFAVESDSMVPKFRKGAVVFVRPVSFEELKKGDVVSVYFKDNDGVFTHRITDIDSQNKRIYTKGDFNMSEDPEPSAAKQVIGKYWFSLPYIGFISLNIDKLQNNAFIFILLGLATAVYVLRIIIQTKKEKSESSDTEV